MRWVVGLTWMLGVLAQTAATASELDIVKDENGLRVVDGGKPVLSYAYGARDAADGGAMPGISSLIGLSGESVLADADQAMVGVSGMFWVWRNSRVDGQAIDTWESTSAHRVFERLVSSKSTPDQAYFVVQNAWIARGGAVGQVVETVEITVGPTHENARQIDLTIQLRSIAAGTLRIQGGPGTGGLCFEINPELQSAELTGGGAVAVSGDEPFLSPWIDLSYREARRSTYSGVAILQHSSNPGFAKANWYVDPEGLICVGLHPSERHELKPGEALTFGYRLHLHRGYGPHLSLERVYSEYLSGTQHAEVE